MPPPPHATELEGERPPTNSQYSFARALYRLSPPTPSFEVAQNSPVTITCLSDTHNLQPQLPLGDVLIHAGGLTEYGTFDEIQDQLDWLNKQPHQHKILIAGKHDILLDEKLTNSTPWKRYPSGDPRRREHLRWGSLIYLEGTSCAIRVRERDLKIFGAPWTPQTGVFAFQHPPETDVWKNAVTEKIDVFVTHELPRGYLDSSKTLQKHIDEEQVLPDSLGLLKEFYRVKPRLIVFGQNYEGRGMKNAVLHEFHKRYDCFTGGKKISLFRAWLAMWIGWIFSRNSMPVAKMINASMSNRESGESFDGPPFSVEF